MSNAFGGRAGFDVDVSHVFPQGVLAALIFVVVRAGGGGARAGAGCEVGLPLCSTALTALLGVGFDPMLLELKLSGLGPGWLPSL